MFSYKKHNKVTVLRLRTYASSFHEASPSHRPRLGGADGRYSTRLVHPTGGWEDVLVQERDRPEDPRSETRPDRSREWGPTDTTAETGSDRDVSGTGSVGPPVVEVGNGKLIPE